MTRDRFNAEIAVGDTVRYRLADSLFEREGPVKEILPSGGMYVENPRNGYLDLMYPSDVTLITPALVAEDTEDDSEWDHDSRACARNTGDSACY